VNDPGNPDQHPDFGDNQEALMRFLAQFGITAGADGQLDPELLMGRMQELLTTFNTQLAGFGAADAASGMNWGFTSDLVRRATAAAGPDPELTSAQRSQVVDAVSLADLWLDAEIEFDRLSTTAAGWRRSDWIDHTLATWQQLVQPVITQLSIAMRALIEADQPPAMEPMLRLAVSSMFAAQLSQTLASLATSVLSGSDLGLPITDEARVCLIPVNLDAFAEGLSATREDLLLYLAVRETARQRLFAAASWLGPQLLALIEHYAREITIDPSALEDAIEGQLNSVASPADLERAGNAVAHSLFAPQQSAEQKEILARLETLLALVEGWVDEVTAQVTAQVMPSAAGLTEMLRRRRATGGPAELALKNLVGLELRPRRTRDAANLWAATRASRGPAGRDAVWAHPDLLPEAADLDDPLGFADGSGHAQLGDELDAELARLLEEEGHGDHS
jgi:putative hydrolase